MNNILFLGGAGFLGSNIIKTTLRKNRVKVFVLEPSFANVSRLDGEDVQIYRGELSDIDYVQSIIEANQIDTVVHLVATIIPGSSFEDYKREYQQVIFPTIELMQICAQRHVKFVYFSSGGTVYGNRTDLRPFVETDAMAPISYYGWSKQMMENSIHYVHRTAGLDYLILRPSNPYGHGQNIHAKQGLIAVAIGKIVADEPIIVWGDGSNVRDYIYIDDLAKAVVQLLSKDVCNTTLNIGSGLGTSINDIISTLKKVVAEEVKVDYLPSRFVDVSHMILDNSRLKQYVDVDFTLLQDGITMFYNEVKSQLQK
ncbi:MAG: NAD-dependent epimerase/dehydratase family protein [Prevotella sp.]|nr:NAD-dependent epimerase/dehydratase family protein [Prevotella sp.]